MADTSMVGREKKTAEDVAVVHQSGPRSEPSEPLLRACRPTCWSLLHPCRRRCPPAAHGGGAANAV